MSENNFELALRPNNSPQTAAVQTSIGRYMQEVQGMVFMAKQFPRDQFAAWGRIKEACSRKTLAETSQYSYPRGGEKVTGPSIRLAEVIAQNWGNISHGVVELEQKLGESTAMAFAWDLETNTRVEKIFTVKHEISTRAKGIKKLTDPRDIYELVANMGARRQRACILAVIPKDVTEAAMEECEKTLKGNNHEPLVDRIKKMLDKFKELGVTKEMVEVHTGYSFDKFTEKDVLDLGKIHNSIRDGIGKREDFFEMTSGNHPEGDNLGAEFDAHLKAQEERKNGSDKK